jgi:type II secretory pathway pseudopilin PulG
MSVASLASPALEGSTHQSRNLKAERFAASGRHQAQRILALNQQAMDDLATGPAASAREDRAAYARYGVPALARLGSRRIPTHRAGGCVRRPS